MFHENPLRENTLRFGFRTILECVVSSVAHIRRLSHPGRCIVTTAV
jgi:hypothetical protein